MLSEAEWIDEGFRAQAALVRPLTCVGPPVVRQIPSLEERSSADVTLEVALVAVSLEMPLQFNVVHITLATQVTEVLPWPVLPLLVTGEAGTRVEVFATLLTFMNFLLSVHGINVFAEVASTHLCAADVTLGRARVTAEAMARQSFAGVKGLLAHLTSEGSRQAEAIPVMHLDVGV